MCIVKKFTDATRTLIIPALIIAAFFPLCSVSTPLQLLMRYGGIRQTQDYEPAYLNRVVYPYRIQHFVPNRQYHPTAGVPGSYDDISGFVKRQALGLSKTVELGPSDERSTQLNEGLFRAERGDGSVKKLYQIQSMGDLGGTMFRFG